MLTLGDRSDRSMVALRVFTCRAPATVVAVPAVETILLAAVAASIDVEVRRGPRDVTLVGTTTGATRNVAGH